METVAEFDAVGASFEDVYGMLAEARAHRPVYFSQQHQGWVITRYDDVARVLRSTNFTVEGVLKAAQNGAYCPEATRILSTGVDWNETPHVQAGDGPDHNRFRRALTGVLNPKRLREMETVVRNLVDRLIDDFIDRGQCEYVGEFAYKLSMLTTLNLIGFREGEDDMSRFPQWVDDTFRFILTPLSDPQQISAATNAVEFQEYVRAKIIARRADPQDDLLSDILSDLSTDRANFSDDELVIMFTHSFVGAGHETTKLALTNAVFHLLGKRERWNELVGNINDAPRFVEETLRLDPPLLAWFRYCTEDTEVGDELIRAGEKVVLMLGSANHDGEKFADSEDFCPFRQEKTSHMTFSAGRHFCIGAPLARIEIKTALERLATRIPSLRLKPDREIRYAPTFGNRAILALDLEWDVAS